MEAQILYIWLSGRTTAKHLRQGRLQSPFDQGLVEKVVDSFVSLSLDDSDINKVSCEVYRDHLENPFLVGSSTQSSTFACGKVAGVLTP